MRRHYNYKQPVRDPSVSHENLTCKCCSQYYYQSRTRIEWKRKGSSPRSKEQSKLSLSLSLSALCYHEEPHWMSVSSSIKQKYYPKRGRGEEPRSKRTGRRDSPKRKRKDFSYVPQHRKGLNLMRREMQIRQTHKQREAWGSGAEGWFPGATPGGGGPRLDGWCRTSYATTMQGPTAGHQ